MGKTHRNSPGQKIVTILVKTRFTAFFACSYKKRVIYFGPPERVNEGLSNEWFSTKRKKQEICIFVQNVIKWVKFTKI